MKILYAVFMAFVCSLAAEEKPRVKERLTLKTALDRVQKNFPLLAAVLQDVRIAQGDLLSSEGAFDGRIGSSGTSSTGYYNNQRMDVLIEQPTMYNGTSLFAGYRLGTGKFPPYYGERETNKYGEFRAGARVPIWRDREIDRGRAGIRQAKIGVRLADLTVEQQKLEIYRNACFRYWDWAAAAEKLKIAKSNYEIAKERQKQIVGRVKAGDLPKIEEKDNERILLQRESQFLSAEQNFQIASNELAIFLRTESEKNFLPAMEQLPENPFDQIRENESIDVEYGLKLALDKRPELKRIQAQKEQNILDRELAKNQMKPGIDFVFAASQDMGPGSETRSKPELEASLVLSIPLATKTQKGKMLSADAKNEKLDAQEKFLRERIEADIRNSFFLLKASLKRADLAKKEKSLAKELEAAERNRFQIGEGTLILVNIREQTSAEALNREVDALAERNRAWALYRTSTGEWTFE